MAEAVFMPKQGQSVETCIITQWYKKKGDSVEKGDLLFAYETDKASFEEEAQSSGILLDVFYDEGDEVPVLTNVGAIGKKGEDASGFAPAGDSPDEAFSEPAPVEEPKAAPVQSQESVSVSGKVRISPRARRMAEHHSIAISSLTGTGPNGRIIARDVENSISSQPVASPSPAPSAKPVMEQPSYEYSGNDEANIIPISNIRKIIAANMQSSLQNSAQLTHHLSADARKMLSLRKLVKTRMNEGGQDNITLNDMVCFAVVRALKKNPAVNGHFLGDSIRQFSKVHLGMAVDTERGLMVPVLKNADDFSLSGLSSRLKSLAAQCREGKIDPELLASTQGSFTVSNLGFYGIEIFTPVLNVPQMGILGVNTIQYQARELESGTIGFVPAIGLSLTYDHRGIDGAPASAFLKDIKDNIENFEQTLD